MKRFVFLITLAMVFTLFVAACKIPHLREVEAEVDYENNV